MPRTIIGVVLVMLMLTSIACTHAPLSSTFNEENANNISVQTVNADAGKVDAGPVTLDGQKSERLLQRYRNDTGKVSRDGLVIGGGTSAGASAGVSTGQKY